MMARRETGAPFCDGGGPRVRANFPSLAFEGACMEQSKDVAGDVVRPEDHAADTNSGKWNTWYAGLKADETGGKYGDAVTYLMAAAFLAGCEEIEDWGCGRGGFRRYCPGRYVGVDGSKTPYASTIAELGVYRSSPDGILLRHVLEHNYNWPKILEAAVQSFRKRLCVVLFTPFADTTRELRHNRDAGVDAPDLALSAAEIEAHFKGLEWKLYPDIRSKSQYGVEHVYCVWRSEPKGAWARMKALFG